MASEGLHAAERMQLEVMALMALMAWLRLDLHPIWDFDEQAIGMAGQAPRLTCQTT